MWYFATTIFCSVLVILYFLLSLSRCFALSRFVSTQIQFHLQRPEFVCRLFKHETAIRRPYFSKTISCDWIKPRQEQEQRFPFQSLGHTKQLHRPYTLCSKYIYGLRATAKFILPNIQVLEFANK